jgi:hypothetical protein
MLKHILIAIIFSLLAILLLHEISWFLHFLVVAYKVILNFLAKFITGNYLAVVIRDALGLFGIAMLVAIIPSCIYWIFTRRQLTYFPHILLVAWLLLLARLA